MTAGARHEALMRMLVERAGRSAREAPGPPGGPPRLCTDAVAVGMDLALLELESETLANIDEAIARLKAGTYGVCSGCDEAISEARLQALPFATVCRDCQAERESGEAARAVPR